MIVKCPNPDCGATYDIPPEKLSRKPECKRCGTALAPPEEPAYAAPAATGPAVARGWAFVVVLAAEFRRAMAAARRYEELKDTAHGDDDPEAGPARRVYLEFYSTRPKETGFSAAARSRSR